MSAKLSLIMTLLGLLLLLGLFAAETDLGAPRPKPLSKLLDKTDCGDREKVFLSLDKVNWNPAESCYEACAKLNRLRAEQKHFVFYEQATLMCCC